jgi:hypothetical protein
MINTRKPLTSLKDKSMKKKEIKYPAICTVHWATGPTDTCDKHARALVALGNMLGTHVPVTKLEKESECMNCKNDPESN